MKHIKKFESENINESKLADSKRELKYFQDELDLDITIDDLMDSIKATNLNLKSIYPSLTGKEKMESLPQNEKFVQQLNELELKLSEFQDSESFETFSRIPLRWYWIYTEDASELEIPVQILFRYYYNDEWSDIKLYMVNDNIENFYDELSLVTIELKVEPRNDKPMKRWFYTTSDSGKTWLLQTNPKQIKDDSEKKPSVGEYVKNRDGEETETEAETKEEINYKIVKSNKPTDTFKKSMSWTEILHLAHNVNTKLIIY